MDWFGAPVDGPLVAIRAVHFFATAVTAGSLIFRAVVAEPALRSTPGDTTVVRSQMLRTAWIGLVIAVISGAVWLQLQAASMSGLPLGEAMTSDVLLTVLNQTQFGLVLEIRLVLAVILAVCLAFDRLALSRWLALASSLGLAATIAWTGHAGSTLDQMGILHLAADILHLTAAAAWIGGLVSLTWLLAETCRDPDSASLARDVTRRFSTLGIVSVGTLFSTGIVNAWMLVGSFNGLIATGYGRLLMIKIALFAVMVTFAAANRFRLTPRLMLSTESGLQLNALRLLTRNSLIEIVLGLAIYGIVGLLGTLHPAIHFL
jgi:putative copper resistance protein D